MNANHFDHLTRALRIDSSRRGLLRGLIVTTGLVAIDTPDALVAKNKHKHKKKLKRNHYGCVDVGGACRGRDKHCCSGRCQGKKPKKGEPDKSRCMAHDTGTIESGERGCRVQDAPSNTGCTTSAGEESGQCQGTTGDGGFCGHGYACIPGSCRKDADCTAACGAGAACIVALGNGCDGTDTWCMGVASTPTCNWG